MTISDLAALLQPPIGLPFPRGRISVMLRVPRLPLYIRSTGGMRAARFINVQNKQMTVRNNSSMKEAKRRSDSNQGVEAVLLAQKNRIVSFLAARGASEGAEDLFHDLWMRLSQRQDGPIANPLSYIMRAANNLMLDRYRSRRQEQLREQAWGEEAITYKASTEAVLISREQLEQVNQAIDKMGERAARIFRRFRVDGISQRDIAVELGVSLSTVEADLRKTYAALAALKRQFDAP